MSFMFYSEKEDLNYGIIFLLTFWVGIFILPLSTKFNDFKLKVVLRYC